MDSRRPVLLTLDCSDLERSLAFWHETLGVPVKLREPGHAELQTETVLLVLRETDEPQTGPGPALGWEDEDLAAAAAELEAKGVELEAPVDSGLRGTRRRFRDPDGHLLELVSYG